MVLNQGEGRTRGKRKRRFFQREGVEGDHVKEAKRKAQSEEIRKSLLKFKKKKMGGSSGVGTRKSQKPRRGGKKVQLE